MNISSTFLSSLLGGCNSKATPNPPKSDNKYVEEMFMKCSTAQSFIRMEMTTYRIGTLADLCEIIKIPLSSDLMPEDFQCQEDLWKPRTKLKQEAF